MIHLFPPSPPHLCRLGVGIGTVSATVVAPSLLRLLLVSAACFASVIAFGSGPDLWHTHAVDAPALVGAAFLSVLSVFVTRLLLNAGGLFATEAEEESNAVAPETAHPDWISRMPSGVVRGTLHDAAAILGTVVWAVRGAIHVLTMRGTLLYAGAWVGTLALFVGVGIMVMTGDRVDLHPAWTLLLLVLWGLQRRNAMGEQPGAQASHESSHVDEAAAL